MGYRFYRMDYENGLKIYQSTFVDVRKRATGEYRIPVMTDAHSEWDISVFKISEELAIFLADWLGLFFEEVKDED